MQLLRPNQKKYQESMLTKQQKLQRQCQLHEHVENLKKQHIKVNRLHEDKFKAYKKLYAEEHQQQDLQHHLQQQITIEAGDMAADAAEKGERSGIVQVLPINRIGRNADRPNIGIRISDCDIISSSSSYSRGGHQGGSSKGAYFHGNNSSGGSSGGADGDTVYNGSSRLYGLFGIIPIAQQPWQYKFAETIKQVLIVLVPYLAFSDLHALSRTCKYLLTSNISSDSAVTNNIAFAFEFSETGAEATDTVAGAIAGTVAGTEKAPDNIRNPIHVRTILNIQLTKVLSRFKLNLETLQNVFNAHPGTVLSGSSILQAYLNEQFESYDLDFYLPLTEEAKAFLIQTLQRQDGEEQHDAQGYKAYLKRVVPLMLAFFDLPKNNYYGAVKLKFSPYFPFHQGFILEMEQHQYVRDLAGPSSRAVVTKRKIQFIFIKMDAYKFSPEKSCGFVIDYFDLSIVKSYFDGSRFRSRCIKDILKRSMTLCTTQCGVRKVNLLTMVRLIKYGHERKIQFLGPILPLDEEARDVYKEYLKETKGRRRYFKYKINSEKKKSIPTEDQVNGKWITEAAKADVYFDYSDSDGSEGPDRHIGQWRRLRGLAMKYRNNKRPSLKLEEHLETNMPRKYSLHRRMLAPGWHPPPKPTADQVNGVWFEKVKEAIPFLFKDHDDNDEQPDDLDEWRKQLRIANYRRHVLGVPDHELEEKLQAMVPQLFADILETKL